MTAMNDLDNALEHHAMLRRMNPKDRDRMFPSVSGGEIVTLGGDRTYAVLTNDAGETVAVYHVVGKPNARGCAHVDLADWRTLLAAYRRRLDDKR
jgi:hypothetical protein